MAIALTSEVSTDAPKSRKQKRRDRKKNSDSQRRSWVATSGTREQGEEGGEEESIKIVVEKVLKD